MRQFIIPTLSPDGIRGGFATRQRDVVAEAVSTIAALAEESRKTALMTAEHQGDRYDDGLVHDHSWARSATH